MRNGITELGARTNSVLDPLSMEDFFSIYWERSPVHIARSDVNPFNALISITAIEELLSTNDLHFPTVQLTQTGQTISVAEYTDENSKIVANRVADRFQQGSTIVLSQAQNLRAELMHLCRQVQVSFGMRCQTNVYLSPAGNQGFNPHFDTHDVFILQVSGKKTFNFYSGGEHLPTSADRFNSDVHKVGDKTEAIELSAGDTLYIPRGMVHDAVADDQEASLHITLGVYPILIHELLSEVLQVGVSRNIELRKALPQRVWRGQDDAGQLPESLIDITKELLAVDIVDEALGRLRDGLALNAIPNLTGALNSIATFSDSDQIAVNEYFVVQAERQSNVFLLRLHGSVLEFEDRFADAVEWLLSNNSAKISALPNLDSAQRQALVSKLMESRVIRLL